jgi:predicted GNAT family acetyltransferase
MGIDVRHDRENHRFTTVIDGAEAYLAYAPAGEGRVDFRSTFSPPELRGRGVAAALVTEALAWARGEGLEVIPTCWYVKKFLDRESGQ